MASESAFVHAWVVSADIEPSVWSAAHAAVVAAVRAASIRLEAGRAEDGLAMLRGPNGFGPLVIQPDIIAFNGNAFLGQAGDAFILERTARGGIISRRTSNGSLRAVRRCDTIGHAYDLAVCSALIALVKQVPDARVGTSGTLRTGWGKAASLVRDVTGESGQLVQLENGLLRWVAGASRDSRPSRSSA